MKKLLLLALLIGGCEKNSVIIANAIINKGCTYNIACNYNINVMCMVSLNKWPFLLLWLGMYGARLIVSR